MSEAHYSKLNFLAVLVDEEPEEFNDWKPGLFFTIQNSQGVVVSLAICLPTRNGKCSWGDCAVGLDDASKPKSPSWIWNGNTAAPTMTPSIHKNGHWHGHLTDGKFVSSK